MEIAEMIIDVVAAGLIAWGLFYTGSQLKLSQKTQKENHDWNRRQAAQQATVDYATKISGNEQLNSALKYSTATNPIDIDVINKHFEEREDLRTICHNLLNYHESLAVGVQQAVYDEEVVKAIRKSTIIRLFNSFQNYIEQMQSQQPTAWKRQEALVLKWRNEDELDNQRDPAG